MGSVLSQESDSARRFQLRRDLEYVEYALGHGSQLVMKDPVRLRYFLFNSMERALLNLLKSPKSVLELKRAADETLAPDVFELSEIRKLIHKLLNDNLLIAGQSGYGAVLRRQGGLERRQTYVSTLLGVLAIRLPGIDPQAFLDAFNPFVRWVFNPLFLATTLIGFFIALVALAMNFTLIQETTAAAQVFSNPRTALAIFVALMVVKVLHELGHAFACRSIGRDCHELGLMLLVFVPCLYCNVSDVWMEPNRWKRILVSAAGIYIEMLIAMLCVPLWLLSHEGPMQTFWFTVIAICSVNTLLINGNPLLRYDGYYVLSDLLQVPNLYASSQAAINQRIAAFFTHSKQVGNRFGFLEIYALMARGYRLFVLGVILFLIYAFFDYVQLPQLGITVAILLFSMSFFGRWLNGLRKFKFGVFWTSMRIGRTILVAGLFFGLLVLLLCCPVTSRTFAEGDSELQGARIIYAPESGRVQWLVARDSEVFPDQVFCVIRNDELEMEMLQQSQLIEELKLLLQNQKLLHRQGADNSREVELHAQSLINAKQVFEQMLKRKQRLQLRSEYGGKLVALPANGERYSDPLDLSRISSSLAGKNKDCLVEKSEPLAAISHPDAMRIRLLVPENRINRVLPGDRVRVIISQLSPNYIDGRVIAIDIDQQQLPRGEDGIAEKLPNQVGVVVQLNELDLDLPLRTHAKAMIYGRTHAIYYYLWHEFKATLDL